MKHVWIIEDNASDVFLIHTALEKTMLPLEITVMTDGEEARRNLESCEAGTIRPPDLLLLDLHLPKTDGADLLELVQRSASLSRTCIGIFSSLPEPPESIRLRASDHYIQKSVHLHEFIGGIIGWVKTCMEIAA